MQLSSEMGKTYTSRNKRIAINTLFLYIRSIVVMAVSIYTSRVVLHALGIDDYGINNVVGGFVGMFAVLSSAMVHSSQRFISYEMGKDNPQLKKVFCVTLSIHFLLVIALIIVFETFGLWFLNNYLNISPDRMRAANWVFQFSIVTFCLGILNTPFNASIISHEKMSAFAYISIFEAFAKLGIVYLLYVSSADKLILYSFLLMMVSATLLCIYIIYCRKHFEECKYQFMYDKSLFKSLLSFSGWNFLGSTAGILVTQGVNILTNIFFGVALNAARGIVEQANSAMNQFVSNFTTALNPQITQSHAAKDYGRMNMLMMRGSKYSALLFWCMGVILFMQPDFVLDLWLVEVPPYAPTFLRLAIIYSCFQALSNPLYIGMLATGNIKKYQIVMSLLYVSSFIACYILFSLGFGPEYGYITTISAIVFAVFVRSFLLQKMIPGFTVREYLKTVLFKFAPTFFISIIADMFIVHFLELRPWIEFICVLFVSLLSIIISSYFISFDQRERQMVKSYILKILNK